MSMADEFDRESFNDGNVKWHHKTEVKPRLSNEVHHCPHWKETLDEKLHEIEELKAEHENDLQRIAEFENVINAYVEVLSKIGNVVRFGECAGLVNTEVAEKVAELIKDRKGKN